MTIAEIQQEILRMKKEQDYQGASSRSILKGL